MYNILVVDDDDINRKLITFMLKKHTDKVANIYEAENGAQALELTQRDSTINLILLDIVMPILDGLDFLTIFRSDERNKDTQVIVLSTDDSKKTKALSLGANDFLTKPIKEKELLEKFQTVTPKLD